MRGHADLCCNTALLDRGGRVYVASLDARAALVGAPSTLTNAQAGAFLDTIVSYPSTKAYDASDFANTKRFNTWVINQAEYHTFNEWNGTQTSDQHGAHWAIWPGTSPLPRPMALVCFIFEMPAKIQSYDISFHASHYTRWPMYSALGVTMSEIPVADNKVVAAVHKEMEKAGRKYQTTSFGGGSG